mgnify:CR=1 FL=1
MPKYYDFMICGYYLYFTSHCIVEAMHVHDSDRRLTESGSAKLFVKVYPSCSSSGIQDTPFFLLIYRGYYISSNDKQPRRISSFFNSGYTWSI